MKLRRSFEVLVHKGRNHATGSKTGGKEIYMAKMRELTKAKESLNKAMMELMLASNFVEDSSALI